MIKGFRIIKEQKPYKCGGCLSTIVADAKHLYFSASAKGYSVTRRLCAKCVFDFLNEMWAELSAYKTVPKLTVERKKWRKEAVALMLKERLVKPKVKVIFTCDKCAGANTCEFAFDPYNTFDDCLSEK